MTFTPSSASGRARPVRAGRRALLIATSVALVSGALLPAAGVASAAQAAPEATGHSRTPIHQYDITLLTGDVVHYADGVGKQDTVTVDRPDGAVGGVHVQQAGDDVYVLPDEATPCWQPESWTAGCSMSRPSPRWATTTRGPVASR